MYGFLYIFAIVIFLVESGPADKPAIFQLLKAKYFDY